MGGLVTRHELAWDDGVICTEHALGEVFRDWFGIEMQIAKHFVGTPSSEELNDVSVDI